jgi:transcriptional regulator with XRE-family HTH domain
VGCDRRGRAKERTSDVEQGIGATVRSVRLRRGLSLDAVAGLVGRDKSWLSRVERGLLPLDRRSDITALANALRVSPIDLIGRPNISGRPEDDATAAVPAISHAIFDRPTAEVRPAAELSAELSALAVLQRSGQAGPAIGAAAASLLDKLRAAAGGPEHAQVMRLTVVASYYLLCVLQDTGHEELALFAAALGERCAEDIDEPVLTGLAAATRAYGLMEIPIGAYAGAVDVASCAADAIALVGGQEAEAACAQLQLAAALACSALGNGEEAADRLAEAGQLAGRVDGPTLFGQHLMFSPASVVLHEIGVALEIGRPENAVTVAARVDLAALPPKRASFGWRELGRAHAALGHDDRAITALSRAEELHPLRVRTHPLAREAVAGMVGRAQRAAVGRDLRGLAYRMGLPH